MNKSGTQILARELRPEDISLIIEVSDTTLDYDLRTKAGVYCRAGVPQYLVIDVNARLVYVHTLTGRGVYTRETRVPGEAIELLAAPHFALTVDNLLLPA